MGRMSFLTLSALVSLMTPALGHAGDGATLGRTAKASYARLALAAHGGIPAWARRYNVNCSFCHAPAAPRLNATGTRFRWAGYRMPEDIGQTASVDHLDNYISIRGRVRYVYSKTQGQPASTNGFQFNDATLFFSGPFGKNYGAFFELEREPSGEVGVQAHVESAWGKEKSYGGFRAGLMHWLLRDGVAGFDRPTGIRTPIPLDATLTSAVPFAFSPDQLGAEAYFVAGRNRISGEVLNGISGTGSVPTSDPDSKKDFVVTDQLLLDDAGSGITAVGYYGSVKGVDPAAATATSHFWRAALSANKWVRDFEAMGGVVYGKDTDLPVVTGGRFTAAEQKGLGYWFYGGYTFRPKSGGKQLNPLTLYGRYEFLDPNTDVSDNAKRRIVAGWVLPALTPEHLRLALEYALDFPQGGGAKKHGLTAELMLNY